MMGGSSDSADNESTSSNSVGHECGCRLAGLVLRNSLTALVVDGVTACRLIANDMLESVGVKTEMVGSGQEALKLIEAHYDLILVDRYVYDIRGTETIQRMRQRGERGRISSLTSGEIAMDRVEMMDAGADGCLEKLLSKDALANILAKIDHR